MADVEDISKWINRVAIESDTDFFIGQVSAIESRILDFTKLLKGTSFKIGSAAGISEVTQEYEKLIKQGQALTPELGRVAGATEKLTAAQKEEIKAAKELAKEYEKASKNNLAAEKKKEAEARKIAADATKEEARMNKLAAFYEKEEAEAHKLSIQALKDDVKGRIDAVAYYKRLNDEYQKAALLSKNLAAQQGVGSVAAKAAAAEAKLLSDKLKEIDSTVGQTTRNVGNYNEGIKQVEVVNNKAAGSISRLYGLIRTAANILPGLGISGIFLLLFEGIKFAVQGMGLFVGESEKAQKAAKKLKEENESLIDSFRSLYEIQNAAQGSSVGELTKVKALADVVLNQSESYERRNRALKELKDINKNYFGDLTLEQSSLQALVKAVDEYNEAIITQAVIKELEGDIGKVGAAYFRQQKEVTAATKALREYRDAQFAATTAAVQSAPPGTIGVSFDDTGVGAGLNEKLKEQLKLLQPLRDQFNQLKGDLRDYTQIALDFKPLNDKGEGKKNNEKLKAQQLVFNDELLKLQQQYYKDLSEIEFQYAATRVLERQKSFAAEKAIIDGERETAIANEKLKQEAVLKQKDVSANDIANAQTEYDNQLANINKKANEDRIKAEKKLADDIVKIRTDSAKRQAEIEKSDAELFKNQSKKTFEEKLAAINDENERLTIRRQQSRDILLDSINSEQILIEEQRPLTEKEEKKFNERRAKVEVEFLRLSLRQNIEYYKKLIELRKAAGEDVSKLEAALQKARVEQSNADLKINADNQKEKLEGLDKYAKQIGRIAHYTNQAFSLIGQALNITFEKRKNQLQEEADLIDKNSKAEIDAVNASTDAASVKADKIAVINARAAAQKAEIERKQRQVDQERARFEKAANIANIITTTALAVVSALKTGIPLAIATAAIGAAQLAFAIATPIPKYKLGTPKGGHPGGPAVVGDGGVSEMVITPDGQLVKTSNRAQLMDLPRGTVVLPNYDKAEKEMRSSGNAEVIAELRGVKQAIQNKREVHFKKGFNSMAMVHKYGNTWIEYEKQHL